MSSIEEQFEQEYFDNSQETSIFIIQKWDFFFVALDAAFDSLNV